MQRNLSCNRQLIFLFIVVHCLSSSFLLGSDSGYGKKNPWLVPVIVNVPAAVTVSCVREVPEAPVLFALDGTDTIRNVTAIDFPGASTLNACSGGVIQRVWSATGSDGSISRDTQVITVLADNSAPAVSLPDVNETIVCEGLSALYPDWLNVQRTRASSLSSDCSPISITDDAPASFTAGCATLVVTFTLTDTCGNASLWRATLNTLDTVPPVVAFVPRDTVLSCLEQVPPPATIMATDNCSGPVSQTFQEINDQQSNGSCAAYEYNIERLWTFSDNCGNTTAVRQKITIVDNSAPIFRAPANITVSCNSDWKDLAITGRPSNIVDCDPDVNVTYTDIVEPGSCGGNFRVRRIWTLSDVCGNLSSASQTITVVDNEKPVFTAPSDLVVSCGDEDNLDITGRPTQLSDNCTPSGDLQAIIASELVLAGNCVSNYTVQRTWQVTDACGNVATKVQTITVKDTTSPIITQTAADLVLDCLEGVNLTAAFEDWLNQRGGALASDACSPSLTWSAVDVSNGLPAAFPGFACPSGSDTVLLSEVAFIVKDACNNTDTTVARFVVLDQEAPSLDACPESVVIYTDPNSCEGTFMLVPPLIRDACAAAVTAHNFAIEQPLTSNAAPGTEAETPVDPIDFSFVPNLSLPLNTAGEVRLSIGLRNVDGELPGEAFLVYGEDNTLIGRSASTNLQCGTSDTTLVIPAALFEQWALDNAINIRLVPVITAGSPGNTAINPICAGAFVRAVLAFDARELPGISFAYQIGTQLPVFVDPIAVTAIQLESGTYSFTYLAIDCAGNTSSCSFEVVVEDRTTPVFTCPEDVAVSLLLDSCQYLYSLPFPEGITDNCSGFATSSLVYPSDTTEALLSYAFDANLNSYVARTKSYAITGLTPNAVGTVELALDLKGDFNSRDAVFEVIGENNTFLGMTTQGVASCSQSGRVVFTLNAARFNEWTADGILNLQLVPKRIVIPSGTPGEGINPCDPTVLDVAGRDGKSWVFVRLSYANADPGFFTRGATLQAFQRFSEFDFKPEVRLEVGETEIFYVLEDLSGNKDTCSFMVTVSDRQLPRARCKPATIFISPSGLDVKVLDVSAINAGSRDNCGIDSMFVSPATFNCSQIGGIVFTALRVVDIHGNTDACFSPIRIEAESPKPTANNGVCGGDTLYLFANPPADGADGIFTYKWYNPSNQLISNQKNPVVPNISAANAGPYRVEIEGLTGCRSSGIVQVSVEPVPLAPDIATNRFICVSEDIVLSASTIPPGNGVKYYWYKKAGEDRVLLGTTTDPRIVVQGPHPEGVQEFYLQVEANGCISSLSGGTEVVATEVPVAVIDNPVFNVCSGETFSLSTSVSGANMTYQWTGPNGFNSTLQFPPAVVAGLEDAGTYTLVVRNNGCASAPVTASVVVRPTPAKPLISSNGAVCEGTPLTLTTNVSNATVYSWVAPDLQMYGTTAPTLNLSAATPSFEGEWRLFVTSSGCQSPLSDPLVVTVNELPEARAGARDTRICEGQTIELEGNPLLDGATYRWTGPARFESNSRNALVSNVSLNNEGNYTLEVTNQEGCTGTSTVGIRILPGVRVTAISNDGPPCLEGPTDIRMLATTFPVNDGTYRFQWTGPGGFVSADSVAVLPNATSINNGNYQLVVTNGNGCSSFPVSTLVDVNDPLAIPSAPRLHTATLPPFCEGDELILETTAYQGLDVFYNWLTPTGMVVTEIPELKLDYLTTDDAGSYTVYVAVDGCISRNSGTTSIRVGAIPEITVTAASPVCSGSQIRLDANFINGATYSWSGPNDFNSTRYNPVINQADTVMSGDYIVTATLSGCSSVPVTTSVVVAPTPLVPAIFTDPAICLDKPGSMLDFSIDIATATNGAFYSWFGPDGQIGAELASRDFELANLEFFSEGIYTFRARARLGNCFSAFSEPVQVIMNEIPSEKAFAGDDVQACSNLPFLLKAKTPGVGNGKWSIVSGNGSDLQFQNLNSPNSSVSGLQGDSVYIFKWTLSNGACVNYDADEVRVSVISPELSNAGPDQIACIFDEIRLAAGPVELSEGIWVQSEAQRGLGIRIADPQNPESVVTGMEPGNLYAFKWQVEGGCGVFEDEVLILISDPNPYAGPDQIACNDDQVSVLMAREPASGSKGAWMSTDPEVLVLDPNQTETMVMGLMPGLNSFVWTIDGGICGELSRDTVVVDFYFLPKAVEDTYAVPFGETQILRVLQNDFIPKQVSLRIVDAPANGTAELLNDSTIAFTPDINFIGPDQFTYEICSDACECSEALVVIKVGEDAPCTPPSIITPNSDQINDVFVVPCLLDANHYPNNSLVIVNRWGDEVFRSSGAYQNNWNGTFDGEQLPDGAYFYILDFGDGSTPVTGFVVIQR